MFEKNDKRRLYWLLDQYLSERITERVFCDEFYYCFDLEIDYSTLDNEEYRSFSELSEIVGRFSEYKEDHDLDSNAFYTKQQLQKKVLETKMKLSHST